MPLTVVIVISFTYFKNIIKTYEKLMKKDLRMRKNKMNGRRREDEECCLWEFHDENGRRKMKFFDVKIANVIN